MQYLNITSIVAENVT